MFENGPDHLSVFDEADDAHGPLTPWADQGIDLVHLLYQPRPAFPEGLFIPLGFEDAGNVVILSRHLSFTPRDVAVPAVITHHLLAPVRDVGTHGGQSFQRGEDLD